MVEENWKKSILLCIEQNKYVYNKQKYYGTQQKLNKKSVSSNFWERNDIVSKPVFNKYSPFSFYLVDSGVI